MALRPRTKCVADVPERREYASTIGEEERKYVVAVGRIRQVCISKALGCLKTCVDPQADLEHLVLEIRPLVGFFLEKMKIPFQFPDDHRQAVHTNVRRELGDQELEHLEGHDLLVDAKLRGNHRKAPCPSLARTKWGVAFTTMARADSRTPVPILILGAPNNMPE